jgi:uncharacterized membrane protein
MAVKYARDKQTASAKVRLLVALIAGVVAGMIAGSVGAWYVAPLAGWDVAAVTYLLWMWLTIRSLDSSETSDFSQREDPSRRIAEFVLLFASIASLGAVAVVLLSSGSSSGSTASTVTGASLGVFSLVLSWLLVHTIYMLRYAELYYHGSPGGVDITGTKDPTFTDFAYLSFTLGMTFQVSDTDLKNTEFRAMALRHAMLSYLFGTVIVASTINLVAGLSG